MPTTFLTLPRELRDKIYELCLLFKEPINPWDSSNYGGELSPALLGTNKAINSEARLLLYQNRFDFTPISSNGVSSFLENIGRNNADCIRHISIEFPSFRGLELGNVTIGDDDIGILEVIQSNCANLKTLTMSRHSTNVMEHRLDELENLKIVAEALTLVNTRFRAISSLQDIIVEVYEDAPSDYIRRQVESHGWTISAAEYVEEWGGLPTMIGTAMMIMSGISTRMMIITASMTTNTTVTFGEGRRTECFS